MSDKIYSILRSISEGWIYEFKYNTARKYKFDYAHLPMKIAVEIEGGIFTGTGHVKIKRYLSDMEKYNDAQLRGWIVLRYAHGQENLITKDIKRAIEKRKREDKLLS